MSSHNLTSPRVWFVTGASSGVGFAMTERALSQGDIVVATLRKPSVLDEFAKKYNREQLLVLPLDVARNDDIVNAFAKAKQVFGRVDIVFNNAGYAVVGEIETTPIKLAQDLFDVNFWGAINVAREAVRFMREDNLPNGGSILNVSSSNLFTPEAGIGYYAATKFALNGALEALSKELSPAWNINLTIIELGGFRTRATTKESIIVAPLHPTYDDPTLPSRQLRLFVPGVRPGVGDITKAAVQIHKLSMIKELPLHFPLGKDALAGAVTKGNVYHEAAKKWASWSEDLAFAETAAVAE